MGILCRGLIALVAITFSGVAAAQAYPSRPIHLVVPFPAGGPTDIVARPLAQKLSEQLGQPVIIDNRGGAGGSIGAAVVAQAAPDGYTLLMATVGTQAINTSLYARLPYDALNDFAPVSLVARAPVALVAHPSVSANSVAELIALSKSLPAGLTFGSAGSGTPGHLSGEIFRSRTGAVIIHVPYKGSAPAIQDLVGGQIQLMFDPVQSVLPLIRSGRAKALAISSAKRSSVLPEVPTMVESGVPGEATTAWWGVVAPAKTPREIVVRLHREIEKALAASDVRDKLLAIGIEPGAMLPDEFSAFIRAETERWGQAVRASGAKVD